MSGVAVLAGRNLRGFLRSPGLFGSALLFPLVLLFMMLAVLGGLVGAMDGAGYVHRLAPLVVLSTISFSASVTAVGFHLATRGPLFDRIRTTPVRPSAMLAGRIVADLVRIMLGAAIVTAVAYLPGFRFRQGWLAALGYGGVVLLVGVLFTALAAAAGVAASTPGGAQGFLNAPTIVLFFLSTGYLPLTAFPGFVQPVVRANPLSFATDAMVGLSYGGPVLVPLLATTLWTVGAGTLAGLLVVRRLRASRLP